MPAPDASPESAAAAEAAPEAPAAAAAVRGVMQAALPRVLLAVALLVLLAVVGPAPAAANPAASVVTAQLRDPADTYVTAYINVTFRDNRGETRSERSETAKFGDGRIGPARGVLVNAKSLSAPGGCAPPLVRHPSRASNSTALPAEPWIALIPRGHCTFDMKVYTAALSGASAVIVFDDKEADTLDMMDISPEHNITAVLTYHWKGLALAKLADGPSKVYAEITVANRCARSLNSINRTSVLFVSVSFIVLMIISLAWLVFYYVQRFRYIHAKDRLSRRLCSAAKRALSKIPTRRLKIDDPELSGDGDCCAICIERYRVADVVRALPCKHEFHKSCIDPWLLDHRTCPMCKMDILKHYGFVFTGSQESILHLDIEEVAAFGLVDSPHPGRGRLQGQGHGQGLQPAREPQSPSPQLPATPQHDEDPQSATRAHQTQQHADDADMPAKCLGAAETGDLDADLADGDKDARCQPSRPTRATSPGGLSSASVASSGSVSSCCSDGSGGSGNSVTHSILPQAKRPHIVATCHGTCHAACQQPSDLSPPQ